MSDYTVTIKVDRTGLGHVFIELSNGVATTASGYYPQNGMPVGNGVVQNDLGRPFQYHKTITITEDQYNAMRGRITQVDQTQTDVYGLLGNNCTQFVRDVLQAGGVEYPTGSGPDPRQLIAPDPSELLDAYLDYRHLFNNAKTAPGSPIILDLDGDGVETVGLSGGAHFDHDSNGFAESTGWVGADDGLLVWDRNGDGRINDGSELFGNETVLTNGTNATNGFQALAQLDTNADGKLDSSDSSWANLRVWKDVNGDAFGTSAELFSLSDAGVQSINVGYTTSTYVDSNHNEHRQVGSFVTTSGATRAATDVWFQRDLMLTVAQEWLEVPTEIDSLPRLSGLGNVYDLHQAMVRDETGDLEELVEAFVSETDPADRNTVLEQILFKWTDVGSYWDTGYSTFQDGRKLEVLEKFFGEDYVSVQFGYHQLTPIAAATLAQSYTGMFELMYAQLMVQTHLKTVYEEIAFTWDDITQSLVSNLDGARTELSSQIAQYGAVGEALATEFIRTVKGFSAQATLPLDQLRSDETLSWLLDSYGMAKIEGTAGNDSLNGTGGAEALRGGGGNDTLVGGGGNDVVYGNAGIDAITSGLGNDLIYGGDGNDTITDSGGTNIIYGGAGADSITAAGNNTINGGDGNDTISTGSYYANTVSGGAGDDSIVVGYGGSNSMDGGSGNDTLSVNGSSPQNTYQYANTFIGGTGNDALYGAASADSYYFNRGDGQDTIYDGSNYSTTDKVLFGAGIVATNLIGSRSGNHLVIQVADPGNPAATDQITVQNWFDPTYGASQYRVETWQFADGTSWGISNINTLLATGTEGNDTLGWSDWSDAVTYQGLGGNDVINAGSNNDTIYGGSGDDTINAGGGTNTIYGGDGADGITSSGSGNIVDGGSGNDSITLSATAGVGNNTVSGGGGNDTITAYWGNNVVQGGDGDDAITVGVGFGTYGYQYGNTVTGGLGNDTLSGSVTWDTYNFSRGDGQDTISELYSGYGRAGDRVLFGAGIVATNLIGSRSGNHLVIQVADPGNPAATDQITVQNWFDPTYGASQYRVETWQFADGTSWGISNINTLLATGTEGNDTLGWSDWSDAVTYQGLGGNDVINAGSNNDTIYGGSGDDTINAGGGTNTIYGGDGADGITSSGSGNIVDGGSGNDSITLSATAGVGNNTVSGGGGNDTITAYWGNNVVQGGDGDDAITVGVGFGTYGYQYGNTVTGGLGNDTLSGSVTWDTYNFSRGDGQDTISELYSGYGRAGDRVLFGAGIVATNLIGSRSGNHLVIQVADPGNPAATDQITVQNWFDPTYGASQYRVETWQFADGTSWGISNINTLLATGTEGNDTLGWSDWSDAVTYQGLGGNDVINAGSNNDTIYGGSGDDTINAGGGTNTIYGGDGADGITSSGSGNIVDGGSGNDSITLSATAGVGNNTVSGGGGNDTITAYWGNNVVQGGDGDDAITVGVGFGTYGYQYGNTVTGGLGNDTLSGSVTWDTYNFSRGDGQDTISELYSGYGRAGDRVLFGAGIVATNLIGSRSGNHLVIQVADPGNPAATDQITVQNWFDPTYGASQYRVETWQFADGSTYDLTYGTSGIDSLAGSTGNNLLFGDAANDTLTGNAGNDLLDGGAGSDTMSGGTGNDLFFVDNAADVVTEAANEGTDSVYGSVSHTLAANVENLILTGTAAINGIGNTLDNTITGNGADNLLNGAAGNDTLAGSAGNDVLEGMDGNDTLNDTGGNNYLAGFAGTDTLTGSSGSELYIGGAGNDTLSTGSGSDVIAFKSGDGQDTVNASTGQDNTISLGGAIAYADLYFRKTSNDLILETSASDQLTLKDWYVGTANHSVLNLQAVSEAMAAYDPNSSDPLLNKKVQQFDFQELVDAFDQAKGADPQLDRWALMNKLLDAHLAGSDTEAIGGDLAYQYSLAGSLAGIGLTPTQTILSNSQFGSAPQTLQPILGLQEGLVRLS